MINLSDKLLKAINNTFSDCVFHIESYDGFWQCSWTDGPTEQQLEHFFLRIFPVDELSPRYTSIKISEGFELYSSKGVLLIRLIRYLSPERYYTITNNIKGSISTDNLIGTEDYLIRNGILPGYNLNVVTNHYYKADNNGENPTILSVAELVKRHRDFSNLTANDKLMLSTLFRIYGANQVYKCLEEGDTIEELFETAAFTIYSDNAPK